MRIFVKAKPGAKNASIKEEPRELFEEKERRFVVAVTERAVEGRANEAIVAAIARHFDVPRACVRIVQGAHGREKVVEVDVR